MPDVIFARPDHTYASYSDFWRLVELSGYPIITIGEIDDASDNVYIFSTPDTHWHDGTVRKGWPNARARIICFNIEWYLDVDYRVVPGVEVWSADKWYAERTGTRYVPLGSHPDLKLRPDSPNGRVYDVVTLAAPSVNRYTAQGQLRMYDVSEAPNAWGDERHTILMQSRAMLHAHQWADRPTVAPQRFALAAAYGLPLITETLADEGIYGKGYKLMCGIDYMGQAVSTWLKPENANHLADYAGALHGLLCEHHTFRKVIEGAL